MFNGVEDSLLAPLLAFNFALWKFREPAHASRNVNDRTWLINRVVESARIVFSSIKPKARKRKIIDPNESVAHNLRVEAMDKHTALCYSDGSASPNPGPCGAGVSIFIKSPDLVLDFGASLGRGTNNIAELFGLGVIFTQLSTLVQLYPQLKRAIVFCDSKLALRASTSNKTPRTNTVLASAVRTAYSNARKKIEIDLQWIRGHVDYGGNERVDQISKMFAATELNNRPLTLSPTFHAVRAVSDWGFGYPLTHLPSHLFKLNLLHPSDRDLVNIEHSVRNMASVAIGAHEHTSASVRTLFETPTVFVNEVDSDQKHDRNGIESKSTAPSSYLTDTTTLQSSDRKRKRPHLASFGSRRSARLNRGSCSNVVPLPPGVLGPLLEGRIADDREVVAIEMTGVRSTDGMDSELMVYREHTSRPSLTSPHEESKSEEVRQETHVAVTRALALRGSPALGCHSSLSKSLVTKPTSEKNKKGWGPTPLLTDTGASSVQPMTVDEGEATFPVLPTG